MLYEFDYTCTVPKQVDRKISIIYKKKSPLVTSLFGDQSQPVKQLIVRTLTLLLDTRIDPSPIEPFNYSTDMTKNPDLLPLKTWWIQTGPSGHKLNGSKQEETSAQNDEFQLDRISD